MYSLNMEECGGSNGDFSDVEEILRLNGLESYIEAFKGMLVIDVLLIQCN